jgi:hypothetical protein
MAIMKKFNAILKISGLMSTALVLMTISGEAASCRQLGLSGAECACKIALASGNQSALRSFVQKYPNSDTACNALASTAPIQSMIVPERDREGGNADDNNSGRQSRD